MQVKQGSGTQYHSKNQGGLGNIQFVPPKEDLGVSYKIPQFCPLMTIIPAQLSTKVPLGSVIDSWKS